MVYYALFLHVVQILAVVAMLLVGVAGFIHTGPEIARVAWGVFSTTTIVVKGYLFTLKIFREEGYIVQYE